MKWTKWTDKEVVKEGIKYYLLVPTFLWEKETIWQNACAS